ncbi:MAG: amidohydrolase [Acetobacterales bacterium]
MAMDDLLLADALLPDGRRADVADAGRGGATRQRIDLGGRLLLPGLIDGHLHLDKTLLGAGWIPHQGEGTVRSRIAGEKAIQDRIGLPLRERAENLLRLALSHGTTTLRTHVDIDPDIGLSRLLPILDLRQAWADRIAIQIVAFPQSGMLPGTVELLDAALSEGADLLGGVDPIGIDGDMDGPLDALFGLAGKRGVGLDIHLHDRGEDGARSIEAMAARTRAAGMEGRVVVSHGFCTADADGARFDGLARSMVEAGMALMTHGGAGRPIVPVAALRAAGVTVFAGSDNVRDSWSPYGNGDMLERAMLIGWRSGFRRDDEIAVAFDLCTGAAARALGVDAGRIEAGAPADLVAIEAGGIPEAVVARPRERLVLKAGRLVHGGFSTIKSQPS